MRQRCFERSGTSRDGKPKAKSTLRREGLARKNARHFLKTKCLLDRFGTPREETNLDICNPELLDVPWFGNFDVVWIASML